MKKRFITLTSDFGIQSQGVGIMEGVIREINPEAQVIHLMHGLPDYDLLYAARTLETLKDLQPGYNVCVVDPGVGTKRKAIIIETGRGDFLVGPDNGVLIPSTRFLGGIKKVVESTNEKYMKHPISPIFHGRSIFAPAAAYLSMGVKIEEFGQALDANDLVKPPYEEAIVQENEINATVISINKFGSLHLNVTHETWDNFKLDKGQTVKLIFDNVSVDLPYFTTFGDVKKGYPLILKDDYSRVEVSLNQDSFKNRHKVKIKDKVIIKKLMQ
jgi:S-adenosyl-L-methionine hydrolase (adenosine-forming)